MSITIPAGYKASPLGIIPIDWGSYNIDQVFDYINTPSFAREDLTFEKTKSEIYYIHYGDIHSTFKSEILDFATEKEVPFLKDVFCNGKFNYLKDGDLIIADASEDYAGVGECIELKNLGSKKVIGGLHTIVLRSKSNLTAPGFNTYIFKTANIHNTLKKIATGISVYSISKGNLSKLKILLPTLPEQIAIGEALSLMDNNINKISELISKKELQKKALIQQLLTGKKRLKGFDGKWNFKRISSISKDVSIKNSRDKEMIVLSCTKYDGLVPSLEYFGRKIYSDDLSTYKIVPINHFAYATNHIEEGSIGYQIKYDEALISPMYTVFKTDSTIDDDFLFKLLKSHSYIHEYQKRMEGSIDRRGGLRWDEFSKIKIPVPALEEQTAIACVLQTADKEIQLLKAKADKLKEQKKGMMQVLLTGKKRLKIV